MSQPFPTGKVKKLEKLVQEVVISLTLTTIQQQDVFYSVTMSIYFISKNKRKIPTLSKIQITYFHSFFIFCEFGSTI